MNLKHGLREGVLFGQALGTYVSCSGGRCNTRLATGAC